MARTAQSIIRCINVRLWTRIRRLAKLTPLWLLTSVASVYAQGEELPQELVSMVDKILSLIQYIGVAVLIGGMIYAGIQLATADTPEEQARAKKKIAAILLAGAIMALAKPVVSWLTGLNPP